MRPSFSLANVLLVALGSAVGGVLRFGVSHLLPSAPGRPAWGTLAVNVAGSLLIGLLLGAVGSERVRLLLATGLCGGFTTFSAFSAETVALLEGGHPAAALANIALNLLLSIAACWLGLWIAGGRG